MIRKLPFAMGRLAAFSLVAVYLLFPLAMAPGYVSMGLALFCGLACGRYVERWQGIRGEPLVWLALGLYAVMLVGALYTVAPASDIRWHLSKYAKLLLVPVFLSLLLDERVRRHALDAFVVAMLLVLASTYANIWWDLPWSKTHNQGWGVDHTVVGDYITQSLMMSFFSVLAVSRGLAQRSWPRRLAWCAAGVLGAVSVAQLSSGRTGYLLLSLGLVTFALVRFTGRRRWLVTLGIVLVLAVMFGTSAEVQHRVLLGWQEARRSGEMQTNSIGGRVTFWTNTLDIASQRPWLGWGTGSYHGLWCERFPRPDWCWLGRWHPHNQYLFLWVEHGLPGLLVFVGLVAMPFYAAYRAEPSKRAVLWAFGVVFAVNSLFNASLWSSRESHFFVLLLVLLYADAVFGARDRRAAASG